MSMSTHVAGFKPPDAKWQAMKDARDACVSAGIAIPPEVEKFFEYEEPDEAGVSVNLERAECLTKYSAYSSDGYELDISKLPKDVKIVRFWNSY